MELRHVKDLFHQENPDKEIPIKVEILVILTLMLKLQLQEIVKTL